MGLFTFIKYLVQHIPDKNFRIVRGYGLFANCIKTKMIEKALKCLKRRAKNKNHKKKDYRERIKDLTGKDPLICNNCKVEMEFWFSRYGPDERILKRFGLSEWDRIPRNQIVAS